MLSLNLFETVSYLKQMPPLAEVVAYVDQLEVLIVRFVMTYF